MNAKVWSNTRSNVLGFHAFPEAKALCNSRINPNDGGTRLTADQAKAQPMTHLCERCVTKLAALEAKAAREANAVKVQALTVSEAQGIANAAGYVVFQGNANTHKRPQGFPEVVRFADMGGNLFALRTESGKVVTRVKGTTRLWVMPCPADIEEIKAEADAKAEAFAETVTMVEMDIAPTLEKAEHVEAREDAAQDEAGKIWCGTASNRLFFHAFPERNAACNKRTWPARAEGFVTLAEIEEWEDARVCERCLNKVGMTPVRADLAEAPQLDTEDVTAQDIADAELASGECVWTDAQVSDAAGMRLVTPEELESLAAGTGEVFWAGTGERPASSATRVKVERRGESVHLVDVETGTPEGSTRTRKSWAAPVTSSDAPQALELSYEARTEAAEFERARVQAERLRNRKSLEIKVPHVKAHRNYRELSVEGNTTAAKRYWMRRCDEYIMVETVKAHARANYDLGWDTVVEAYSDEEILEFCRERGCVTVGDALSAFRDLTDVWAERQCNALVEGYGV